MLKIILLVFLLIPFSVFAQLTISPAPISGEIDLDSTSATITFANTTNTPIVMNLALQVVPGFSMGINRCAGKTLSKNQSCYIILNVNDSLLSPGLNIARLDNNGSLLVTFNRTKIQGSGSSVFPQAPTVNINDFTIQTISIQNLTPTIRTYSPTLSGTDASKYDIILNRCQSVGVGKTCNISVQLKQQFAGSYTATLTEPQVTGSLTINSTITNATVGVKIPDVQAFSISPSTFDFGTLTSYGVSSTKFTVTFTNTGNVFATPSINLSSSLKMVLNRCGSRIAPNSSCQFIVSALIGNDIDSQTTISGQRVRVSLAPDNYKDVTTAIATNIDLRCSPGYHQERSLCVSDTMTNSSRACQTIPTGQVDGIEFWDNFSNDWSGFCSARSQSDCSSGWTFNALAQACMTTSNGTYSGVTNLPAGYTLVKDVFERSSYGNIYNNSHSACVVSSSNPIFVGQEFEIFSQNFGHLTSQECSQLVSAKLNNDIRTSKPYFYQCDINLPLAGKLRHASVSNSLDPNFCHNLNFATATYKTNFKQQLDVFSANPKNLTQFDGKLFYIRYMPYNNYGILSSTTGVSGNSMDHSAFNVGVKSMAVFENNLYVIADELNGSNKTNVYKLSSASETISLVSSNIIYSSTSTLSVVFKKDSLLIFLGDTGVGGNLGIIKPGQTQITMLSNVDRDLQVNNFIQSASIFLSPDHFTLVGNKLYVKNEFLFVNYGNGWEPGTWYYDASNNNFHNIVYDVYDLNTNSGQIAINLETITASPETNHILMNVGSKTYFTRDDGFIYELDQSTHILSSISLSGLQIPTISLVNGNDAYVLAWSSDYSTQHLLKLDSTSNTISTISNNFPFYTKLLKYNSSNQTVLVRNDIRIGVLDLSNGAVNFVTTLLDESGNAVPDPYDYGYFYNEADKIIISNNNDIYFLASVRLWYDNGVWSVNWSPTSTNSVDEIRIAEYKNGVLKMIPSLCTDKLKQKNYWDNVLQISVNKVKAYSNKDMQFWGGSLYFSGNACQNEASDYGTGQILEGFELYKYNP